MSEERRLTTPAGMALGLIVSLLLVGAVLLAVMGCGVTAGSSDYWTKAVVVDVNGRQIPCVIWKSYNVGGISCDWSAR